MRGRERAFEEERAVALNLDMYQTFVSFAPQSANFPLLALNSVPRARDDSERFDAFANLT